MRLRERGGDSRAPAFTFQRERKRREKEKGGEGAVCSVAVLVVRRIRLRTCVCRFRFVFLVFSQNFVCLKKYFFSCEGKKLVSFLEEGISLCCEVAVQDESVFHWSQI